MPKAVTVIFIMVKTIVNIDIIIIWQVGIYNIPYFAWSQHLFFSIIFLIILNASLLLVGFFYYVSFLLITYYS